MSGAGWILLVYIQTHPKNTLVRVARRISRLMGIHDSCGHKYLGYKASLLTMTSQRINGNAVIRCAGVHDESVMNSATYGHSGTNSSYDVAPSP